METPPQHPDHYNLSQGLHIHKQKETLTANHIPALKALREAADHADKLVNQRKNIDKVLSIQSQLIAETGEVLRNIPP